MLCYRDRMFCKDSTCQKFATCPGALTDEVAAAAKAAGMEDYICLSLERRKCFVERNDARMGMNAEQGGEEYGAR